MPCGPFWTADMYMVEIGSTGSAGAGGVNAKTPFGLSQIILVRYSTGLLADIYWIQGVNEKIRIKESGIILNGVWYLHATFP